MNNENLHIKSMTVSVSAPFGDTELRDCLAQGSRVQYIDFVGATMRHADGSTYEMKLEAPIRFSPGSHIGMAYDSDEYKREDKDAGHGFKTAISMAMTDDARILRTVFQPAAALDKGLDGWSPQELNFVVYYEAASDYMGNALIPDGLPRYRMIDTVAAVRVLSMQSHPQQPGYQLVQTDPPINDLRISNLFVNTHNVSDGYLLLHDGGDLSYETTSNFLAHYARAEHDVHATSEVDRPILGRGNERSTAAPAAH